MFFCAVENSTCRSGSLSEGLTVDCAWLLTLDSNFLPTIPLGVSMKKPIRLPLVALLLMTGASISAKPVSLENAIAAVKGWTGGKKQIQKMVTVKDEDPFAAFAPTRGGDPLFYVAQLRSGGYVVTSADDELTPVVAYSETDTFLTDPENPLYGMLKVDLEGRMQTLEASRRASRGFRADPLSKDDFPALWEKLIQMGSRLEGQGPTRGITSIEDVRVEPMVISRWNQSALSDGSKFYNIFIPGERSAGCTATALAQVVRYYEWPLEGIGAQTHRCTIIGPNGTEELQLPTRGGDGQGGPYDWKLMVLSPNRLSTQAEKEMVASLTYDAAVSINTEWSSSGGGAFFQVSAKALKETFLFENAEYLAPASGAGTLTNSADFLPIVNSNLDASLPVMLGVFRKKPDGTTGGHTVVCDGYGYHQKVPYHHVNLGWGGSSTAWYNFPVIDAGSYKYDYISGMVYNVYPKGTGFCVSGQVLASDNQPIAGATVLLGEVQATTNAKGIFAFSRVAPGSYTLQATSEGHNFAPRNLEIKSNQWQITFGGSQTAPVITIQPQPVTIPAKEKAALSVVASGIELQYQWYQRVSETLTLPIKTATAALYTAGPLTRTSSYFVRVTNAHGSVDSDTVTVTVEDVAPKIDKHPQGVTIASGQKAQLKVTATGYPLNYQWYKGPVGVIDEPVSGAKSATWTTPSLTESASYWVRVSNSKGTVDSQGATITVVNVTPAAIAKQPQSVTVKLGESANLSVEATGTDLAYQWFTGASGDETQPIANATSAALTTTPLAENTTFWVRVSNLAGFVNSASALVSVEMPEVIQNGNFESGATSWSGTTARIGAWPKQPAFDGTQCAWLGGMGRRATHTLIQPLNIPAALPQATLTFQLHIDTAERSGSQDKLVVSILDAQGALLKTLATYTHRDATSGYIPRSFDLSEFKDREIKLQFKATEDSLYQTSFVVDGVILNRN